jgi:hypothetical protein
VVHASRAGWHDRAGGYVAAQHSVSLRGSRVMRFDLRIAIGALFTVYGLLLALYGLLGDKAQYSRSLGLNVNLLWGGVLLVFGLCMLLIRARVRKN